MLDKFERLEENISVLQEIKNTHSVQQINELISVQWSVRYGLLESIQIVIDVSCNLCSKFNLGSPANYGDCIRKLIQYKYLSEQLGNTLLSAIGLRNLLVHQYAIIKPDMLYDFLNQVHIFKEFVYELKKYI